MSVWEALFGVLTPSNAVLFGLVAGLLLLPFAWQLGVAAIVAATLVFVTAAWTPLPARLFHELQTRVPPGVIGSPPDAIVVIGGFGTMANDGSMRIDFDERVDRVLEGAALAQEYPGAKLVLSDGVPDPKNLSSAQGSAAMLRALKFPAERLVVEPHALSTLDNAELVADLVDPQPGRSYVLVTSAFHMPRALATFHAAGWPAMTPWPVDRSASSLTRWTLVPDAAGGLELLDVLAREYAATLYYWWKGRIATLRPSMPETLGTHRAPDSPQR